MHHVEAPEKDGNVATLGLAIKTHHENLERHKAKVLTTIGRNFKTFKGFFVIDGL